MTRTVRVLRSGALTTLQDGGRPGLAHLAVPRSGALDPDAFHLANRLVGNRPDLAVLETTMDGVTLEPLQAATFAVTGAPAPVRVDGRPVDFGLPLYVRPRATLDVGACTAGVRSYVAVAGGFDVALVLGSASTDLLSGLGPAALADGGALALGEPDHAPPAVDVAPYPTPDDRIRLDLALGPRDDWLAPEALDLLTHASFTVNSESNRIGLRLSGPALERSRTGELRSEGMAWGSVQLLPNGQLVVFLADHPTTGGYPVVGVVDADQARLCAQARPGTAVAFRLRRIRISAGSPRPKRRRPAAPEPPPASQARPGSWP